MRKEEPRGDPSKENTDLGPIIDQRQFDNIRKLVEATVAAGARVVLDGPSEGLVMHPVILAGVTNDMPAARNVSALHEFTTEYWITIQERARPYPS
jgi:acyl-CoA reductase-like NAD-dependent aldehyde dehydrogenase